MSAGDGLVWPHFGRLFEECVPSLPPAIQPLTHSTDDPDMTPLARTDGVDPDAVLLMAFSNGDGDAARRLAQRLTPLVLTLVVRMLGNLAEAEEIAQEAMMRLWQIAPDWRPNEARLSTWMYQVGLNLCTDRLRRRRSMIDVSELPGLVDTAPAAPEQILMQTRHRALADALACLPERQAAAVSLRHLEGLSNPEIAEIMDIGVEAVESLVARGKRALAALLVDRRRELGFQDE